MKRFLLLMTFISSSTLLFPAGPELSGVFDSTVNYTRGAGESEAHSWGIEEYANLRLRVRTGEKATFFASFNLVAQAGNYLGGGLLDTISKDPLLGSVMQFSSPNYFAALELERLYFRINGDYVDAEAGLLRLNFGYGQVWGSSDFLNPRNPLVINARPRGVLGMNASFYPVDSLKLQGFIAGPKDPLRTSGGGFLPGLSLDQHWNRASLQFLYVFETPGADFTWGLHRFGLSLKADLELGLVADVLYTLNARNPYGIDGLSAGMGFDYNFRDGDLYILFEYLFNGFSSVSAQKFGGSWINHHYIYGTALNRFNDYVNASLSVVFCFDDFSFSPFLTFNYELFQGFTLSLIARFNLDQKDFRGSKAGELGPVPSSLAGTPLEGHGARVMVYAGARLRF